MLWIRYGDEVQTALDEADSGIRDPGNRRPFPGLPGPGRRWGVGDSGCVHGVPGNPGSPGGRHPGGSPGPDGGSRRGQPMKAGLPRNQIREIVAGVIPEGAAWAPDAEVMLDLAMANLAAQTGGPQERTDRSESIPDRPQERSTLSPAALDSIAQLTRTIQMAQEEP